MIIHSSEKMLAEARASTEAMVIRTLFNEAASVARQLGVTDLEKVAVAALQLNARLGAPHHPQFVIGQLWIQQLWNQRQTGKYKYKDKQTAQAQDKGPMNSSHHDRTYSYGSLLAGSP
jgi:hypothetical protein